MWTNSSSSDGADVAGGSEDQIHVGVADLAVTNGAILTSSGLGSCVGIAVYVESDAPIGGLLHAMLPSANDDARDPPAVAAKYVDSGIDKLLSRVEAAGAERSQLVAKMAGGSEMLDLAVEDPVGQRNVSAARQYLDRLGVSVAGEDVGGGRGRSLRFDPSTGELMVTNAHGDAVNL